jgi:ABC-type transport system substrate-binding protein
MKPFRIKPGPVVIAISALALVALAVGVPIVWKPAADAPTTTPSINPHGIRHVEPQAPSAPTVFRFFQENPTALDAARASDAYSCTVIAQIYSPLVGLTSNLEPTPQAADSWTISRDGLTYVFHIREGVRFHNGREVTAGDFAYSITRVFTEPFLSEGLAAGYLDAIAGVPEFINGKAKSIRGIQALDNHRLRITLSRPYRPLLTALALDQTSAVPREVIEAHGKSALDVQPVGCGPFRFVRREGAQGVVLAANPDYFMGRPAIDTLVFHAPHGDVTSQGADALLDGRATLSALPADRIEEFRARRGITMLRWQDLSLAFLGMNVSIKPLDDPRVRRAIALAIDRQGMLDLQPEGKTLAQGILPPGLPGYTPVQKTYPRDVAEARRLIADAGYGPDHPMPLLKIYRSTTTHAQLQVDSLMVRSLREAGIPAAMNYVTWAVLDRTITQRKAPLFSLSWVADIPDPDTFLRALFYSSSGLNYFRYSNASVDSLLDVARAADDPTVRQSAYERAEEMILREAPFVPLHNPASFIGMRDDVVGLEMNPLGISTLAMEKLRFAEPTGEERRSAGR